MEVGLTARRVTAGSADLAEVDRLNREAFPVEERIPTDKLLELTERGLDFFALYDGTTLVGTVSVYPWEKLAYVFFLAVVPELRDRGFGSRILSFVRDQYPGAEIVIDEELPGGEAGEAGQRLRRRAFYMRNGFYPSGITITYFGVTYEILSTEKVFSEESFARLFASFTRGGAPAFRFEMRRQSDGEVLYAGEKKDAAAQKTLDYYNSHADQFIAHTVDADMGEIEDEFLAMLPEGGRILDFGCGSGRDTAYFLGKGYAAAAVDGSEKLCKAAEALTGIPVVCADFRDYEPEGIFDGIWACASLLHLPPRDVVSVIKKLTDHLRDGGVFYMSFKYGNFEGERKGRYFTDLTEESFADLLRSVPELTLIRTKITGDVRPGRGEEKWLNLWLRKTGA